MRRSFLFYYAMRQYSGFTLIELLIVCAVLAAVSYVAWGAYVDVDRRAENDLARTELMRLALALKRFHNDTGYWPGEGPFQPSDGCALDGINALEPSAPGMSAFADQQGWFLSPANFSLLFEAPVFCVGHRLSFLAGWDAETRRGWNGPYLPLNVRHWLDYGTLADIPSFAAGPPFGVQAENAACMGDLNACAFKWKMIPSFTAGYRPDKHNFSRHAKPFLFFLNPPRVIYGGMDGRFGGFPASGSLCLPNAASPDGLDDLVICL